MSDVNTEVPISVQDLQIEQKEKHSEEEDEKSETPKDDPQLVTEEENPPDSPESEKEEEEIDDEAKLAEDLKLEEKRNNMDPKHLELFEAIDKGDLDKVKKFITEEGISPNINDEHDMSPLLQASFKGHVEISKFLISRGAEVNTTCHTNFYTPLMMAAISGKQEMVKVLLDAGASVSMVNSIGKSATDLAGFVGQHEIATFIRNYLTMDRLEPYYTPQGDNPSRISKPLASALQEIVRATNYHPVKIVVAVHENPDLCNIESLKKSASVMDDLCVKCVRAKDDFDEVLALKLHYISAVLHLCKEHLMKNQENLTSVIKLLLKEDEKGVKLGCERVIRKTLMKFPFTDLPLLQYLVKALSPIKLGEEPTALSCIQTVFNGMQAMRNSDSWCSACGDRKADLRCSACKKVKYCGQRCQKLHWFVHKKNCRKEKPQQPEQPAEDSK